MAQCAGEVDGDPLLLGTIVSVYEKKDACSNRMSANSEGGHYVLHIYVYIFFFQTWQNNISYVFRLTVFGVYALGAGMLGFLKVIKTQKSSSLGRRNS